MGGAQDQADLGAPATGGPGHLYAHQAGGGVGQKSDRVQMLTGGSGGYQKVDAFKVLGGQ